MDLSGILYDQMRWFWAKDGVFLKGKGIKFLSTNPYRVLAYFTGIDRRMRMI